MKRFFLFALAVVMIAVASLAVGYSDVQAKTGVQAQTKIYKWDVPYAMYRGNWDWEIVERWCADLKTASGGRLDFTPRACGEIMPVMETFDAVSSGALKIDLTYGPYWIGKLPMAIYASGLPPFTLPNWENYSVLYNERGFKELLRKSYAKHNIFYAGFLPTNNAVLLSDWPVTKAADLKGHKIRATGLYAELLAEAGSAPVYFPWGEIYGALEKGVVDGVIAGCLSIECGSGFHEPVKYFLETPITPVDGWSLHVNMDAWNELPEDLQQILIQSLPYAADLFCGSYFVHDVEWRKKLVDAGYTPTTLSVEEQQRMRGYSMKVLDKYSTKDADFAEATTVLKTYMNELGLIKQ
jgi:TRAP-type mannitol/chloroaromatic compound transport system substrate-binding protein